MLNNEYNLTPPKSKVTKPRSRREKKTPELSATAYELFVIDALKKRGYNPIKAPKLNTEGYDISVKTEKNGTWAIQVKNLKTPVSPKDILKFHKFITNFSGFKHGAIVSWNGYTTPCFTMSEVLLPTQQKILLYEHDHDNFTIRLAQKSLKLPPPLWIGIFAAKGGVGKTTIAAHLAGALALCGFKILILDIDPQLSLYKLAGGDKYQGEARIIAVKRNSPEITIPVLKYDDYAKILPNIDDGTIVICDCSPSPSANPKAIMSQLKHCIVPVTMNPLGLSDHCDTIKKTLDNLINQYLCSLETIFILPNSYDDDSNKKVSTYYKDVVSDICKTIPGQKVTIFYPNECVINYSKLLWNWGVDKLLDKSDDLKLVFGKGGENSQPEIDFFELAHKILEEHEFSKTLPPSAHKDCFQQE